jgi:tetratricopeptide (TPR) repeat protein
MSLLMDALKRAEEAKRHQQESSAAASAPSASGGASGGSPTVPELSLEPVAQQTKGGLPDLDSHIESVDADLKATAAATEPPPKRKNAAAAAANLAAQRTTAQAVFAAKDDASAEPATQTKRLLVICGIGVLAAAAVGTYFYWQLELIAAKGNRLAARPGTPLVTRPVAVAPLPQVPAPSQAPSLPQQTTSEGAQKSQDAAPTGVPPGPAPVQPKPTRRSEVAATSTSQGSAPAAGDSAKTLARPDSTASQAKPRKVASTVPAGPGQSADQAPLRVSAQSLESPVVRAYDDLQAGRLDAAKAGYQQALRADRRNADALAGLATIAQREGNIDSAERLFLQAIEVDPRHAGAHAGLAALRGDDGAATESRLKSLISQQGNDSSAAGALHFALGNHYAAQRRWSDAQQSFFRAHTSDAEQPDYLVNLAVSLDHLGQSALARKYYEKAIKATEKRPAAFDKAGVEKRLAELGR